MKVGDKVTYVQEYGSFHTQKRTLTITRETKTLWVCGIHRFYKRNLRELGVNATLMEFNDDDFDNLTIGFNLKKIK